MKTIFALCLGLSLISASLIPTEPQNPVLTPTISPLQGTAWVRACLEQYPEIRWLADANVRKTEEGRATQQGSYSEQLFGQKFIEFDRTIMTLHSLRLILDGSEQAYEQFTTVQPAKERLSRKSFGELHMEAMQLVNSGKLGISPSEVKEVLVAALVLGDMGKSEEARKLFKPYGPSAPDHDDFHEEAMGVLKTHPELCPTFARLSSNAQKLVIETANLAHYGHVTHIEGGPNMFSHLKEKAPSPEALRLDAFVHRCDVAGAAGHVNNQSSLVYTEKAHGAMSAVDEACREVLKPGKTEVDGYDLYLKRRAEWLGLNPENRLGRALTRIGAMLRLFTREEGLVLKNHAEKLDPKALSQIVAQFDPDPKDVLARTPTYIPAVFVNLGLEQTFDLGLPFVARVLEAHKASIAKGLADPNIPLNFNKVAGTAKTERSTLAKDFVIDRDGVVTVVAK